MDRVRSDQRLQRVKERASRSVVHPGQRWPCLRRGDGAGVAGRATSKASTAFSASKKGPEGKRDGFPPGSNRRPKPWRRSESGTIIPRTGAQPYGLVTCARAVTTPGIGVIALHDDDTRRLRRPFAGGRARIRSRLSPAAVPADGSALMSRSMAACKNPSRSRPWLYNLTGCQRHRLSPSSQTCRLN